METNRHAVPNALILSATIALISSLACAQQTVVPQRAMTVATSSDTADVPSAAASVGTAAILSSETGVRSAAAAGPESLRRYVQRTRMIYSYYYWTFARQQ